MRRRQVTYYVNGTMIAAYRMDPDGLIPWYLLTVDMYACTLERPASANAQRLALCTIEQS